MSALKQELPESGGASTGDSSGSQDDPAIEALGEKILERLRTVYDPEIPVNIYELGLIYKIDITPAKTEVSGVVAGRYDVHITMTLTTPNCPVAGQMPGMVEAAVRTLEDLGEVRIELVFDPPWDKSRMSDEARLQLNMF